MAFRKVQLKADKVIISSPPQLYIEFEGKRWMSFRDSPFVSYAELPPNSIEVEFDRRPYPGRCAVNTFIPIKENA